MAKILIVGGAGYVGSSAAAWLVDRGHEIVVLDDLSTGHRELVVGSEFVRGRAGDREIVGPLLARGRFDCVMHFAAKSLVAESVAKPKEYFENNVDQTRLLLEIMLDAKVKRFVFSSTCAIFGDPGTDRIHENLEKKPLNPYGETKLAVEKMLDAFARDRGLQAVALRYFNAAGCEPKGRVGEWHAVETHLIPRVLKAAASDEPVQIFGTDYPTPDGTCIRDYIHVTDLAAAHAAAMERLLRTSVGSPGKFEFFNLGSENGYSVREVIVACEKVLGRKLKTVEKPRRPGDPPKLVADSTLAKRELGFKSEFGIEKIVESAWKWEEKVSKRAHRAVFLDRDGTLNEDPGYLSHPDQLKIFPGVGEALAELKKAGFELVVVSNQSGVGRNLIEEKMIPKIHERLDENLSRFGARIDHYELCFHTPGDDCDCRKPKPKLILDAAEKRGVDLSRSFMIGDKASDIGAGWVAGCQAAILVRTGEGEKTLSARDSLRPAYVAEDLSRAVKWIIERDRKPLS